MSQLISFQMVLVAASQIGAFASIGLATDTILVGPLVFRAQAVVSFLPTYPVRSVMSGHVGRSVVELEVAETGAVSSLRVLEAPDPEIGASVSSALNKWRFRPFELKSRNENVRARSRLIFYFKIENGVGIVTDAAQQLNARSDKR
jgi:TonB family protein